VKITQRGFWVSSVYKWCSVVYWSVYSLYFRSLTYFSVANPQIYLGGMLDERKSDIYQHVPKQYLPQTLLCPPDKAITAGEILKKFNLPVIIKPNVGFRGFMVKKIDTQEELIEVLKEFRNKEMLVQDFVSLPHEYSVMYFRIDEKRFGVSSLVEKHLPVVIGDGRSTVMELIKKMNNPFLNQEWIFKKNATDLERVMDIDERYYVDYVGNYARGSKFENLNHLIDNQLIRAVHAFYERIEGMHFCRMDIKAASMQDLKNGKFKLLEINGAKSEPLHIYDPRMSWWSILKTTHVHWTTLFKIVKENIHQIDLPSTLEGVRSVD